MEPDPRTWIAELRNGHDRLAAFVHGASTDDLTHPSRCSEWSVAQVLSHLGSGAEIGLATVTDTAVDNEAVWGRWNAMAPSEQASNFVRADDELVAWYEGLSHEALATVQIQLPFLPGPIDVAGAAGFRLSEVGLHSWDVFAAFDPSATVAPGATALLVDQLPMMAGFVGNFTPRETRPADPTTISVTTSEPERHLALELGDSVELRPAADADTAGTLTLPAEALVRLVAGRLAPDREAGASITGALTLDDLRRAFPGY